MRKRHEEWVAFAKEELEFAKIGFREAFYSKTCFLSQQAIEKLFKACLIRKTGDYPKTHKLVDLYTLLKAPWLKPFETGIKLVDAFYIPTRYPEGIPGSLPTRLPHEREAKEALEIAKQLFDLIASKIRN